MVGDQWWGSSGNFVIYAVDPGVLLGNSLGDIARCLSIITHLTRQQPHINITFQV